MLNVNYIFDFEFGIVCKRWLGLLLFGLGCWVLPRDKGFLVTAKRMENEGPTLTKLKDRGQKDVEQSPHQRIPSDF